MGAEVTGIPDFWDEKFHSPRVPPGDDQQLTEETVDSGYEIDVQLYQQSIDIPLARHETLENQDDVYTYLETNGTSFSYILQLGF